MSGGHFNYDQYLIKTISDSIQSVIDRNDSTEKDEYGYTVGRGYSPETIARFRKAVEVLERASIYAQRIDWLLSDDDGEDTFAQRLDRELADHAKR